MTANKTSADIVDLDGVSPEPQRSGEIEPSAFVSVGAYLEAVRVAADLNIDAVVARTHIRPQFISAIEEMSLDRLPAQPFAIGFVRSYAEVLGLDADSIVGRFKQEAGYGDRRLDSEVEESAKETASAAAVPEPAPARSDLSLLSVIALLAFMIWCASWLAKPTDITVPGGLNELPQTVGGSAAPSGTQGAARASGQSAITQRPSGAQPVPAAPILVDARPLESVDPVYPMRCIAGAQPIETVDVAFTVRIDGRVVSERVEQASNPCFRRAAINAIRQWRFQPMSVDGAPRAAFDQKVVFTFARPA